MKCDSVVLKPLEPFLGDTIIIPCDPLFRGPALMNIQKSQLFAIHRADCWMKFHPLCYDKMFGFRGVLWGPQLKP